MQDDVEMEIEKMRVRIVELTNRVNLVSDYDEKENMKSEIERIQKQISTLERLPKK